MARTKTGRITVRMSEADRKLLQAAADVEGCSLADFLTRAAVASAESALAVRDVAGAGAAFDDLLGDPMPKLEKLLASPSVFED